MFHLINVRDDIDEWFIFAETETDARNQANTDPGTYGPIWSDPSKATCQIVIPTGQTPDTDDSAILDETVPAVSPDAPTAEVLPASVIDADQTPALIPVDTTAPPTADVPVPGDPVHIDPNGD